MDSTGRSGRKLPLVPEIKELNRFTDEIQAGVAFFFFFPQTWRAERMRNQRGKFIYNGFLFFNHMQSDSPREF